MTTLIHDFSSRHFLCVDHEDYPTVSDLKQVILQHQDESCDSCFFICNGKLVGNDEPVRPNLIYHTYLRLPGGKGGFGSMLRAIGAQIEKTTNHEACRDLSGRRMRDINNEKDLKDWLAKQAEREKEKEQRRQERLARRRALPNHKFDDPKYDQQKFLLAENQEDALSKGLQKAKVKSCATATVTSEEAAGCKRKSEASGSSTAAKKKKGPEWIGIDMDNMSDLSSDDDYSEGASARPGPSTDSDNSRSSGEAYTIAASPGTSGLGAEPGTSKTENYTNSSHVDKSNSVEADSTDRSSASTDESSQAIDSSVNGDSKGEVVKIESNKTNGENCQNDVSSNSNMSDSSDSKESQPLDLDAVSSAEELQSFGLDRLKAELMSRGLKCGGTLEQRADRLFSVKGLNPDQIDPALFAKSNGKNVKNKK